MLQIYFIFLSFWKVYYSSFQVTVISIKKKNNRKVNESLPQLTCLNFIFLLLLFSH